MIQGVPGKPNKAGGSDNSQACQHGPKEERVACFPFPGWKFCCNSLRQETHLFLYFFFLSKNSSSGSSCSLGSRLLLTNVMLLGSFFPGGESKESLQFVRMPWMISVYIWGTKTDTSARSSQGVEQNILRRKIRHEVRVNWGMMVCAFVLSTYSHTPYEDCAPVVPSFSGDGSVLQKGPVGWYRLGFWWVCCYYYYFFNHFDTS